LKVIEINIFDNLVLSELIRRKELESFSKHKEIGEVEKQIEIRKCDN
jgi:hypothetical protein